MELDPVANRMWINGVGETGRHRWDAAWLALLALGGHDSPERACHAGDLDDQVAALGQRVPLNRKQLSRLHDGLAALFLRHGLDLSQRLRHAPRTRTVGPWWWVAQAGDQVLLRGDALVPAARPRAALQPLPQMARSPGLPPLLAICRLALNYQPSWEGGHFAAVLPLLADTQAWRDASPEMQAMRWLQTASSHLHTRRLAEGHISLARAQRILDRAPVAAAYLGVWATTLRLGLARIDPDDRLRHDGAGELDLLLSHLPGAAAPEADRLSRLFLFNFAAVGQVQQLRLALDRHARADARRHVQQATRLFSAALFCAFTGRHFDHMVSVLAYVGSFAHLQVESGLDTDVDLPLHWFMLGNQIQHKLELVDSTGLVAAGLGHCWLSLPQARRRFDALAGQQAWAGPRPDSAAFYQACCEVTRNLGDPRYLGKALINQLRFARESGRPAEARRAQAELQRLYLASPGLPDLYRAEGWPTG
ncbi:hypothetical protein BurJ1DRAFT_3645 [Burkholderiales bacterium JOSHI_001]|nr:hypothetical protein BurJ1DRAFT_3645 [Burkholderiales bacterium JOSHI_001]